MAVPGQQVPALPPLRGEAAWVAAEGGIGEAYAALAETHSAVVFFVGERAYKLKKPVDLGFLDFTEPGARAAACRREVELNRRFAPDVYLGVAAIHGPGGGVCDHLVVMRRMPAARRLSTLVRAGVPVECPLRQVARVLAAWHAVAPRSAQISAQGSPDAVRARWEASIRQLRGLAGRLPELVAVDEVERLAGRFIAGRGALFEERVGGGYIVDGHGDLLADDIFCLDDGVRILDCLEFDDRLRWVNALDDAAFLAMDLERIGAPGLAETFTRWYAGYSADPAPAALCHHYTAYRALVRAKVALLRAAQGDPLSGAEAWKLAAMTLDHLQAGAVTLVLVGGLPGTGKTTLAGALAGSGSPCSAATGSARNWPAFRQSSIAPRRGRPESTHRAGPSAPTGSCSGARAGCSPAVNQSSRTHPGNHQVTGPPPQRWPAPRKPTRWHCTALPGRMSRSGGWRPEPAASPMPMRPWPGKWPPRRHHGHRP